VCVCVSSCAQVVTVVDSITPSYYHHEMLTVEGEYKQVRFDVHAQTLMHTHAHTCIHTHAHTCMHTHARTHIHILTRCSQWREGASIWVGGAHTHTHAHTHHTHTNTHIRAHTHMHTLISRSQTWSWASLHTSPTSSLLTATCTTPAFSKWIHA